MAPVLPYFAIWAGLFLVKNAWITLLGFHLTILFVLAIARPGTSVEILFRTKHYTWIRRSILACAGLGVAIFFLHPYLGVAQDVPSQLVSIGLNNSTWPAFITYFSLTNPLIEEYFWRAYLGSDTRGFYVGDVIYAGYHGLVLWGKVLPLTNLIVLACLAFVGWLWRQIRREDEGLLVPVVGHMAADFTILTSVFLITR